MKNKRDEKHVRIKAVIITCFLMMSVMTVGGCSGTKDNTVSDTTTSEAAGGLELSDYVGMTEDEFLTETGFEKNDFGMYPDINHAAVICMDGLVNSLMINEYNSENTFKGYSVGGSLDELDGLISAYNLVDTSEIEGGTRNTYMNSGYDAALAVDVDDQSKVFGISYVILSDDTAGSDTEVDDSNTGLENVSKELKVLEENGFDTSILTTEEQVIVSYAKFVAVSSVSGDGITPTRTMDDIISEIFEYGFASDLSDYNSYGILNYYIDCEIYKGITTTAAEIIDEQYDIGDGWAAMDQVDAELASDIMYFEDNDLRETTMSFTYWDEANEVTLDLTYIGQKSNGDYVGNFKLHRSAYDYDTEQTETQDGTGTFVEDTNRNGTLTFENGEEVYYYLHWSDDHDVLTIDLDGETMDLLEANWAYDNVG